MKARLSRVVNRNSLLDDFYLSSSSFSLHRWGVTGVCMEYEDMFPFDGLVQSIRHRQAYSKNDIEKINQLARHTTQFTQLLMEHSRFGMIGWESRLPSMQSFLEVI